MTTLTINLKLRGSLVGNFQVGGRISAEGGRLERATLLCFAVRDLLDNLEMPLEDFLELYQYLQECPQQGLTVDRMAAEKQAAEETEP